MELTQHPLSAAFPAMNADDFQALKDDIEINGQREPVMVFEGMVLDGWHRHRACSDLGLKVTQFTFTDGDPVAFVLSHNLHRRHLSASQRAAAVVACTAWAPKGRPNKAEMVSAFSRDKEMAKTAGTSDRTIRDAKTAHKAGLGDAVKQGALTAHEAAQVARGKPEKPVEKKEPDAPAPKVPPAEDFGPSDAEVATAQREQEEELTSLRRIAESDDRLKAALAEVKRFREENRILRELVNSLLNEKNAAIRAAKTWQRKAEAVAA